MSSKRSWYLFLSFLTVALIFVSVPGSASTPTCDGLVATIVGDGGDNVLEGTSGDDVIYAGGGDDIVDGKGGNDTICGASGDDELEGGKGNDLLLGGSGHDILSGNGGSDTVNGGKGIDLCRQGSKKKCERKASIERDFFEQMNEARVDRCGEDVLRRHSKYDWMAGVHSWDMAVHDFLSHDSPTYGDFATRVETFRIPGSIFGENVAWLLGASITADGFFDQLWSSAVHRDNMCDPDWELTGIGVIVSGDEGWLTQVFGA
jgi:hypothetical protein